MTGLHFPALFSLIGLHNNLIGYIFVCLLSVVPSSNVASLRTGICFVQCCISKAENSVCPMVGIQQIFLEWRKEGRKWKFSKGSSWSHRVRLRIWDSKCALKTVITESLEGIIFQLWSRKLNQRERCRITVCRRTRKDWKDKKDWTPQMPSQGASGHLSKSQAWDVILNKL